jgi:hypothetical protein
MKKVIILIFLAGISAFLPSICFTQETKPSCLEAIEFMTGFGWGKLRVKDNYNLYPIAVDFDFSLKALTKKFNFNPGQLLQFQIEPYVAYVSSPNSNTETGVSFFLKIGLLPQTHKLQLYVKAGAGPSYMTLHTREQSTQFNFIDTGCIGFHYFFNKDTAFTLEGRYRHLSNSGIDDPNSGINTAFILTGISYQF